MSERLYTYSVLFHPTAKEREDSDAKTQVVVPPTEYALFASDTAVQAAALRHDSVTDEMIQNADRLEVAVRPF